MLCLSAFVTVVIFLTHSIRTAHVTDSPNVYDRLYKKLEKLNTPDKLYEKIDELNSVDPDWRQMKFLTAMPTWLNTKQMDGVLKDFQRLKAETQAQRRERFEDSDQEYGDSDWNDEDGDHFQDPDISDGDYPINDDWDTDELSVLADSSSTEKPSILGVTPSAITRLEPVRTVVSAAASIAATNTRPRIIPDPNMTPKERRQLISAVMQRTNAMVHLSECLVPQPRWLIVKQLAPAADTAYTPPCVQLHRCAPDAGCCTNEEDVCAPIGGEHVLLPFYLHKADGSMKVVRMQFYNHTQCACVSRDTLQSTIITRMSMGMMGVSNPSLTERQEDEKPTRVGERQNDWRTPTQEPTLYKEDDDSTAPPQLRKCTCPGLFLASTSDTVRCSCICDWPDATRRRDCLSLARGKEHFGLRDRVCVQVGNCTPPSCEYGPYERAVGRCPLRKYRRVRYHRGGRYHEKV